jgi:hypothetical protein
MRCSRRTLWLAAILITEWLLFLWKYHHFFNGDSLYFFSHRLEGWADILRVFRRPDALWQYRPLTFVIFTYFLYPLFGLNPLGYNLFPLLVHGVNTLIVYQILRLLDLSERGVMLGTFVFGAHSVAFYVTYGVAFLPDFSYSFFYLFSLFCFLEFLRANKRWSLSLSLAAFVLALFCKEAAATLPAMVLVIAMLWGRGRTGTVQGFFTHNLRLAVRRTLPYLLIGVAYLGFHWYVKHGQLYAPGINHPYYAEMSLYSLHFKYKYLKWAFNLPDGLVFAYEGLGNYLIALSVLGFAIPFASTTIKRLWSYDRIAWCGSIWFLVTLSPVLFLRNVTMHHNLYVPLVGLALMMGSWLDIAADRLVSAGRARKLLLIPAFVAVFVAAVSFHNLHAMEDSWIARASTIAENSLQDLRNLKPPLPDGATLYIVDKSPLPLGDLQWFYDCGSLFRLFCPAKSLNVYFVSRGGRLPSQAGTSDEAIILEFDGDHLSESTGK